MDTLIGENVLYVIYWNPKDYPGKHVVRPWRIDAPEARPVGLAVEADTLDAARELLPDGLVNLGRMEKDDPCIVETWI